MSNQFRKPLRVIVLMATVVWPAASFAQLKVMMSGGFSAYDTLRPEFEKNTGVSVETSHRESYGKGPNTIAGQINQGVSADVVIMTRDALDQLIADGKIIRGTDADLAQSPLGVSVRTGASKPDISTAGAVKQFLLRANCITFPHHTSGAYMKEKVFSQLGLTEITAKITDAGAAAVARGDCEIAIQPVSELFHAPGVDFVGILPADVQYISTFSAAVVTGSKELDASKRLIAFLSSARAADAIKQTGLEPPHSR